MALAYLNPIAAIPLAAGAVVGLDAATSTNKPKTTYSSAIVVFAANGRLKSYQLSGSTNAYHTGWM